MVMRFLSLVGCAAALATAMTASSVRAASVDHFDVGADPSAGEYAAGSLLGQDPTIGGWTGPWLDGCCGSPTVIGTGLTYPGLPVAGGAAESAPNNTAGRVGRLLASPVDDTTVGTLYMSVLLQAVDAAIDQSITYGGLELHDGGFDDGGNRKLQLVVGENFGGGGQTPDYTVRLFGSSDPQFNADLGANNGNVNLFVMKFELSDVSDADVFSIYRNPDLSTGLEPAIPDFTTTGFSISFDRTSLARFGDNGTLRFDELRLGPTYASVVPEPASIALCLLGLAAGGLRWRRR